jgi:excisionase family DNA binding protein
MGPCPLAGLSLLVLASCANARLVFVCAKLLAAEALLLPSSNEAFMAAGPVYLSTHQIARMLGVSLPTVVNWTNAGKLKAHRTPGGHRRIAREELLRFANEFSYPLPPELQVGTGPPRVLMVDSERDFIEMVAEYLNLRGEVETRVADGPFSIGLEVGRFRPHVLMVDLELSTIDPIRLARLLADDKEVGTPRLIGMLAFPDPHRQERARAVGYEVVLHKPVSLDEVWEAIRGLLVNR